MAKALEIGIVTSAFELHNIASPRRYGPVFFGPKSLSERRWFAAGAALGLAGIVGVHAGLVKWPGPHSGDPLLDFPPEAALTASTSSATISPANLILHWDAITGQQYRPPADERSVTDKKGNETR